MAWFELKGDMRLGRCASENCGGQPTWRLEAGGIGSNYCAGCKSHIEAEEFLKPSREYLARLDAAIKQSEFDTIKKIERIGDDEDYENELWRRHYASIEPLRREREAVAKVITGYYARQPLPPLIIPAA